MVLLFTIQATYSQGDKWNLARIFYIFCVVSVVLGLLCKLLIIRKE